MKVRLKHKKYEYSGLLFMLPSFIGVAIFVLIPFLDVMRRSFVSGLNEIFVGFGNYITIFKNTAFLLAAKNTIRFSITCIPLLVLISLIVAVFLYRQGSISNLLKTIYLLPMAIPVASIVLIWKVLFHTQGSINGLLNSFHIVPIDWMNSKYSFWILVFSYIWKNLGYNVVLWLAGIAGISESINEAARVDGAGELKIFFFITLPNLMPTLYTISVLSLLNSFKVFREAYLVAGDYPHTDMYLMQHLFNNWFREMSLDKLAAAAVLMAIVILLFILLLQRSWDKND